MNFEKLRGPWRVRTNNGAVIRDRDGEVVARINTEGLTENEIRDRSRLFSNSPDLMTAAQDVVVRFQLEHGTTEKHCRCLQYEDLGMCRHINLLKMVNRINNGDKRPLEFLEP